MDKMALTYSFRRDLKVPMKVNAFGPSGGDTDVGDGDLAVCCDCMSMLMHCYTFSLKRDMHVFVRARDRLYGRSL